MLLQEYVSEGTSHPVMYDDEVYKLSRVKSASNFVSTGSKEIKEEIRVIPMTKILHQQKTPKSNVTIQKSHQKLRLHNDCGPT